jgi:PAS domain S-box-containing protein
LEILVSQATTSIAEAQRSLTWTMVAGITVVILLSSVLGYVLAKRISRPLDQLRDSANSLRRGKLDEPIVADSRVREVAQVAYALEDARIALRHSLEQLRQEKAWGDHLLESVVEGIITLDRQNRITFFSLGAERITGWTGEQALRASIDEVFRLPGDNGSFSQRIPVPGGNQETVAVLARGKPLTLAITGARLAPTEAGKSDLALVLRDVTNEEAIRRLLGDFLANITHEFRTPLTAQAVSIELLLDQLDDLDASELRELLTAHYLGVLSLQTLIDNLLEGASIEAGRFRVSPQPTELGEVITKATTTVRPLVEKYGLELQVQLPESIPLVQADARRTAQVLVNLLSNAIKWSEKGGVIRLSAFAGDREMKVMVADQGPGIPAEQKGELFTWLPNLPAKNGRADYGAGLGLSVVRTIVEAQGGHVGADDGPGGGTVFWFTVPFLEQERAGEEAAPPESSSQ